MIRLIDASRLALTKLRTRKVRLFITTIISCLLFSALATFSFVFRGAVNSILDFSEEGFGKRYITQAQSGPISNTYSLMSDPAILDRATVLQKEMVSQKQAAAKKLGIEYDTVSEEPVSFEYDTPAGKERNLNTLNKNAQQAILEYQTQHPSAGLADLKILSEKYQPIEYYSSQAMPYGSSEFILRILKDGKENFEPVSMEFGQSGLDSFSQMWQLASNKLIEPFTLADISYDIKDTSSIPIVAPYSAIEQLLKLQPLGASAKPEIKLQRLKDVRASAAKVTFQVCYRNITSNAKINDAQAILDDIARNKNNKDYKQPDLIYDLPVAACGDPAVKRDVRTAETKKLTDKQQQFRRQFGEPEPLSQILNFRIIGVSPDPPNFTASGVAQLISSIVMSSPGQGWFTPMEVKDHHPVINTIFNPTSLSPQIVSQDSFYVEFGNPEDAKNFNNRENCNPDFSALSATGNGNPFAVCLTNGHKFMLSPYGSSSLATAEAGTWFSKVFKIAALVVMAVAALIMMGNVGRIIADSRRETAVFRAIGAKRLDIVLIYLAYTIMVSAIITILAFCIGYGLAQLADHRYGSEMTVQALLTYNARDLTRSIHLFAFVKQDVIYIVLSVFVAGLISSIIPLLHNIRRNPIRDMRDDT